MEKFLRDLGIQADLELVSDVEGKITYDNLDQIFELYSILDGSDKLEEDTENSFISEDELNVVFFGDKFSIKLYSNSEENINELTIRKIEEN